MPDNIPESFEIVFNESLLKRVGIEFPSTPEDDSVGDTLISDVIDTFIQRMEDVRFCAQAFIPMAYDYRQSIMETLLKDLLEGDKQLENSSPIQQVKGFHKVYSTMRRLEKSQRSEFKHVLAKGIFLSMFSEFDTFMSELISRIYSKKPELYASLNGSMSISQMLN